MKPINRTSFLTAATALAGAASAASGALVVQYKTPMAVAAGGTVTATVGPNGTAYTALTVATQTAATGTTAYGLGNDGNGGGNNLGTGWTTGTPFNTLTASDGSFTAIALVTPADNSNDNIVFGTTGSQPLHLGLRNNTIQFGFWSNDSNSAAGTAPAPGTTAVIAWRFQGNTTGNTDGVQSIFLNGTDINDSGGHGPLADAADNLVIGTTGGNGGDFNGAVNDVRLYNTALSSANVTLISNQMLLGTPEPASITVLGAGALGLLFRRRRRRTG